MTIDLELIYKHLLNSSKDHSKDKKIFFRNFIRNLLFLVEIKEAGSSNGDIDFEKIGKYIDLKVFVKECWELKNMKDSRAVSFVSYVCDIFEVDYEDVVKNDELVYSQMISECTYLKTESAKLLFESMGKITEILLFSDCPVISKKVG